ncbi:hypothetical protein MNEG_8069 [Monoraphidium neglectum]|uniref:Magnesium transporter n=1 Tax=Monoraphidium neglectum TaxID=145388 RepID=A0A0D2N0P0_9CHLO|nr:hypothetical protein MNEG_8069 [Monoraphidium neglectum]KIY99890.1 hypothetical protein MNEG_8069 [Monoraphidium neglectum]|eukprot:XP_013898910.1 hypothetical protein MNEG_8069 [Monoraphidium neglectum]
MTSVAGYFGMNLNSYIQEEPVYFNLVTGVSTAGAFVFFVSFVVILWKKGLLVL